VTCCRRRSLMVFCVALAAMCIHREANAFRVTAVRTPHGAGLPGSAHYAYGQTIHTRAANSDARIPRAGEHVSC